MDSIIIDIFAKKHVAPIPLDAPDPDFPTRIEGIGCMYCDKIYKTDAMLLVEHLQKKHGLKIKEILPSIK